MSTVATQTRSHLHSGRLMLSLCRWAGTWDSALPSAAAPHALLAASAAESPAHSQKHTVTTYLAALALSFNS